MDARIAANPREAQIGGTPGIKERVRRGQARARARARAPPDASEIGGVDVCAARAQAQAYLKLLIAQMPRTGASLLPRLEVCGPCRRSQGPARGR